MHEVSNHQQPDYLFKKSPYEHQRKQQSSTLWTLSNGNCLTKPSNAASVYMSCVHYDDGTKNVQIPLFLFPGAMVQGMISISLWCALHKPMYTYIYIQFSGVTAYMIFVRSFVPEVVAPSCSLNIDAGKTRVLFPLLLCSLWCVQI